MKNYAVVVAHPKTGLVITPSKKNTDWGTVRLDQEKVVINNGLMVKQRRTAFLRGEIAVLEEQGFTEDSADSKQIGTIIRKESFKPFFEDQEPKMNPETEELVLKDGKPVYLEFEFTKDLDRKDVWLEETPYSAKLKAEAGEVVESTSEEGAEQEM